jgi:hypothetical protein
MLLYLQLLADIIMLLYLQVLADIIMLLYLQLLADIIMYIYAYFHIVHWAKHEPLRWGNVHQKHQDQGQGHYHSHCNSFP